MDKAKLIDKLNQAIALEWGAVHQYSHYSHVLTGTERRVWHEFFEDNAEESYKHAQLFSSKVVSLGGTPATEHEPVKQTTDLMEMLRNSLATERRAVKVYTEAMHLAEDSPAYRHLLETQVEDETNDVEELEKYLNQIDKAANMTPDQRAAKVA